ncbi:MAG: DUF6599 family protein [Candidatus Acidiferrales bacterium]
MRRQIFLFTVAFVLAASATFAQGTLPNSFAGWTTSAKGNFSSGASGDGTAATIAKEYGLTAREQATYANGPETLSVTLYQMADPSGAYGEYSYLRTPDMARADLTDHSSISHERALALIGNMVVDIHGKDIPKLGPELKTLVAAVARKAQTGPLPWIEARLPTDNIVQRSDHYLLGPVTLNQFFPLGADDWLGFSHGAEAETAQYQVGGQNATLLIADFPTPQIAADELSRLQKRFNVNGSNPGGNSPPLFAKRTVTMLSIVYGAPTEAAANTLLSQIESGTQLTWNEPTFQFKEPTIENMIVGSIVGTGIICGFTLIAALAFGGFRLVIKRALPNRVFDRSSQIQVLQLGLMSKPINAEDFYQLDGTPAPNVHVDKNLPDRVALKLFR